MTNKLFKSDFILLASENARTFADGCRLEIQEYLDSFQDGKVYLENTSLSNEEFSLLDNKEQLDVALVDADGNHVLFPMVQPFQAQWIIDKMTDEEFARVYKTADAVSVNQYLELSAKQYESDKMMDLLGEEVWKVLKFNLDMYEYKLRIVSDSEFGLTDMQYDEEDERIISKMELLKFFIDDIENRIYVLPVEDSKPHKKDLSILREAIAIEEIEIHRTRATRLEKHMTNKTVAKILDEWLDMQSYTVYIDELGQLYYIDEIKANNSDRAEYIQATSLHDIVKLIISEIETAILDATLNEIYDDEEIEELYRRDLRILKAYARW